MRVPVRVRGQGLAFDITPLIDIVFLLVIFFLVASHFAQRENQLAVDLPDLQDTTEYEESRRRLVVTITANRALHVGDQPCDLFHIETILQEDAAEDSANYEVQIRGDASTPYSVIEPLMLLCAEHGVTRVGFKVHQAAE